MTPVVRQSSAHVPGIRRAAVNINSPPALRYAFNGYYSFSTVGTTDSGVDERKAFPGNSMTTDNTPGFVAAGNGTIILKSNNGGGQSDRLTFPRRSGQPRRDDEHDDLPIVR